MLDFYLELANDWQKIAERGEVAREYLIHLRDETISEDPERVQLAEENVPDPEGFQEFISGASA